MCQIDQDQMRLENVALTAAFFAIRGEISLEKSAC